MKSFKTNKRESERECMCVSKTGFLLRTNFHGEWLHSCVEAGIAVMEELLVVSWVGNKRHTTTGRMDCENITKLR